MKMISSKQYIKDILDQRKEAILKENAVKVKEENEKKRKEKEESEVYEEMVQRQSIPAKYNKFVTSVKEEFLGECIHYVFNESLNVFDRKNKKQEQVKRALVKNFIQEQGVDKLLYKFSRTNVLLSEFALIVNDALQEVLETTTSYNMNSWTIDTDIKDKFIDNLHNCNSKEAIISITDRVTDAETDFVNDNMRKKMEIDDIMKSKKEKLDSLPPKASEELKESVAANFDRKIKAIKNRHVTSVYQVLAEAMTKNALSDPELRKIYISEGNLDMDTLLEDTGIIYTFLETLYTTQMVDKEYVNTFIAKV